MIAILVSRFRKDRLFLGISFRSSTSADEPTLIRKISTGSAISGA
jgi:hypothetical protein